MREILFRGKRKNTGEWLEGNYVHASEGEGTYEYEQHFIQIVPRYGGLGAAYEVIPETVGQWTGLTDKNGKKIFEGDIVYNGSGDPGIVKWFYGSFVIHFTNGDVWDVSQYIKEEYTEVIGNIHDNPELLEVK